MTGRDLLKDRSLKPVKIAESDIDVSEQGSQTTPRLPAAPRPGVGSFRQGLDGSVAKGFRVTLQGHALSSSSQALFNLFLFTGQAEHLL